jgi:hypothetical protein
MTAFSPRLDVLPSPQRLLWPLLNQIPKGFVLYGGTALALRLGHRESVDFDFFTSRPFAPDSLLASIPFLAEGQIEQSEADTLTVWIRPIERQRAVKISFFGGIDFPVLARPDRPDARSIVIASMLDLAGTKAKVINQRVELKDYLDIDELLKAGMSLPEIAGAAVAIFRGQVDYATTISAITYFGGRETSEFPDALKSRLRAAAVNAVPAPQPKMQYPSIAASATAVGR